MRNPLDSYRVLDPGVDRPLDAVSRKQAIQHFELHVASIGERLAELQELVEPAGIDLDFSGRSLEQLDEWFPEMITTWAVADNWPLPKAFSICSDVAMYLGEFLRRRAPHLEWRLETGGKRHISYHRPVIAGFRNVKYPNRYSVDYDDILCGYAVRLAEGGDAEPDLIPDLVGTRLQYV